MADGTIKIGIELDDAGVARQAQVEGKKAGERFSEGFEGSSKDVGDKADSAIKGAGKNAKSAGSSAGKDYASGFDSQSKNLGDKVDKAIDSAGAGAKSAGKEAGKEYASGFESETKDLGSSIDFGGAMGKMSGAAGLAAGAVGVFAGAVAAAGAAGAGLVSVANDVGEDMGKLATAAEVSATSWDDAHDTYRDMVGILGEVDQSVEATNHMLVMAQGNTEDLAKWTDIAAGVYATFGDSLPIEGLTEAANETMRVGQVVGPMADALNWASMSTEEWTDALEGHEPAQKAFREALEEGLSAEDAFNAALAECNDEQDRGEIITAALSAAYDDAAEAYKETNKNVIEFRKAQSDLNEALAEAGELLMPLGSTLLTGFSDALQGVLDKVNEFGPQLQEAFANGDYNLGGEIVGKMVSEMAAEFPERLPEIIEDGTEFMMGFFQGLAENMPTAMQAWADSFLGSGDVLLTALEDLMRWVGDNYPVWAAAWKEQGPKLIEDLGELVKEHAPEIMEAMVYLVSQMVAGLMLALPSLMAAWAQVFADLLVEMQQWALDSAFWAGYAGGQSVSEFIDEIDELPAKLALWLAETLRKAQSWADEMSKEAEDTASRFLRSLEYDIRSIPGKFPEWLAGAVEAVREWGEDLAEAGRQAANNFVDDVVSALTFGAVRIGTAASSATSAAGGGARSAAMPMSASAAVPMTASALSAFSEPENGGAPGVMMLSASPLGAGISGAVYGALERSAEQLVATFSSGKSTAGVVNVYNNDNRSTTTQNNTFTSEVQSAAEIARTLRLQQKYGLAGAR